MKRIGFASLCVMLLATDGRAWSVRPPGGLWDNFGVGSWVIIHSRTTAADQIDEQRVKMTLVQKSDDRPFVSIARKVNGAFTNLGRPRRQIRGFHPDELGMTPSKMQTGRVTIDGTRHECRIESFKGHDRKRGLSRKLKLWRVASVAVPYREIIVDRGANVALGPHVVRSEYTVTLGRRTTSYRLELTSIATPVEITARTLQCFLEKGTAKIRDGQERSNVQTQRWLSSEVPGHVVMSRSTYDADDIKLQKVERVESFKSVSR